MDYVQEHPEEVNKIASVQKKVRCGKYSYNLTCASLLLTVMLYTCFLLNGCKCAGKMRMHN